MSAPIWSVTCAEEDCSDCASVLSAMNSTPDTSASIIRLTAFTPPPPTPTTRSCGGPTPRLVTEPHSYWWAAGGGGGASSAGGAIMSPGISALNAWRSRSCGVGVARSGTTAGSGGRCGSSPARGSSPSVSVLRNRLANGPSRMLARLPLPIREHLLRQPAIRVGRLPIGVVLQDGHPFHGCFRETDGLLDARPEHAIPEVLLEDLDRLLGMQRPRVHHRREDARDVDVRIEVLADHGERVLELEEPAHRQILALHRDDHLVGGRERIHRQESQRRRRIDAHEVVITAYAAQRLVQRTLAPDLHRHRDLHVPEVDRG